MKKNKTEWIEVFRSFMEEKMTAILSMKTEKKTKTKEINNCITRLKEDTINRVYYEAITNTWDTEMLLNEILLITYASYIVMLEYRNKVWPYDYMAFARRIGEMWEPFCKTTFEYPIKELTIIDPPSFDEIQNDIRQDTINYIDRLHIEEGEKAKLKELFDIPWKIVDSGGIKLGLDLHFEQDGIRYNCDFKSGFSSNEKGNTNRLLLVASIYNSLGKIEKTLLFVRQAEDENNHYLQTLKKSPYWEVYCADDSYDVMMRFTGFDLRRWLDTNIDWENDISKELYEHLEKHDLLKYLTW